MQLTRLRLAGFKSFVEPTDLRIESGLTGIVGPNGCGKSNLVEALRWVMGESAARQMRASELDDVIFAGTAARAARNYAEVALAIDNQDGLAPPPYRDQPLIEVVRRLPRGGASGYRINGRSARARDVKQLLADAATGARSTAIVAQGQIGAFVAAKPTERRGVLEEAAGVAGLYSRRQEAETRLRAAESNLERLEDVLSAMGAQRQALEKQARHARRYRKLQQQAREAELALFALRWQSAALAEAEAERAVRSARLGEEESARAAAHAAKLHADAATALPALRKAEAEAAARWQRLAVERDAHQQEAKRVAAEQEQVAARIVSLQGDLDREASLAAEAAAALDALAKEARQLEADAATGAASGRTLQAAVERCQDALSRAEAVAEAAGKALAAANADRNAAGRQKRDAETRLASLTRQREQAARDHAAAAGSLPADEAIEAANQAATLARRARNAVQGELAKARDAEASSETVATQASELRQAAERTRLQCKTEADTLRKVLSGVRAPLLDLLTVRPGYEQALAAALGDDIAADLDTAKPLHWRGGLDQPNQRLPEDCACLSDFVQAPGALMPRLSQIGVAPDPLTAASLAKALKPGQRLVTRYGGLWRWDGYTALPGAPTAAAQRLEQRNRLAALDKEQKAADAALEAATVEAQAAAKARSVAVQARNQARDRLRAAEGALAKADQQASQLSQARAVGLSRVQTLADSVQRLTAECEEWGTTLDQADRTLAALASPAAVEAAAGEARAAVARAREDWLAARSTFDRHTQIAAARLKRQEAIQHETESWQRRANDRHSAALSERLSAEQARAALLAVRPTELEAEVARLADILVDAEAGRRVAADRLVQGEAVLADCEKGQKTAEAEAAATREARILADSTLAQMRQASQNLAERIGERLALTPAQLPEVDESADAESLEQRVLRLQREREGLGTVNLLADEEITALEARLATLIAERDDLTAAIAKLRRGIGDLNRNAREKLLAAFESVNRHFGRLFTRLFGGGEAQLRLVGHDDPLEAGLEVFACPPGKKPQALTALSGGERALTAVALLFAAFLTNPAPICVLDEVDAPLDDANVDRLCRLIEEIADEAGTRFLCITHHRLTMARMDRLYGVTMEERGVSRLVSVDLRQADSFRQPRQSMRAAE